MSWETVIGLEVHVQLKTRSKIFCGCSAAFGDPPNTNVCPVCLGLPGALPVPNGRAVELAVRAALALGCDVHRRSIFARKSYFYPDLPKGYQISQFDEPLATEGEIRITSPERGEITVGIIRLHLEEDAAKSFHDSVPGKTAVDFNRSGVPLIEIVSAPDIRSPADARSYLSDLKQVMQYLDVSDCNMEEGSLRVDANLSVRRAGEPLGVKQELKNMNSFAAVERALNQLRGLQLETLESGDSVEQATYTVAADTLRRLRTKEESNDYRYFPEPDLPPLVLQDSVLDSARETMPELPAQRKKRFVTKYALSEYDAGVLTSTRALADYYESVTELAADPKTAANWVMGPVLADAKESGGEFRIRPHRIAELITLVDEGTISNQAAKRVLSEVASSDADPRKIAARLGLLQVGDAEQLESWIDAVLENNRDETERYRAGERKLFGFLIGQIMKESGGKADPKRVQAILKEKLKG